MKRGLLATAWLIGALGLAAAAWWGVPQLEARASAENRPDLIDVHFVNAPTWVEGQLEAHLVRTVEPLLSADPLERRSLIAAREALQATGWFEEVAQVRRVRAGLIEIEARFLQPYALVRDDAGDHLIDPQGRLMPRVYPHGDGPPLVVIRGQRFDRPGRAGIAWEGADITAALRLLRIIDAEEWREQVRAIDIAGQIRGEPMVLLTNRETRIVWGSAPGEETPLEALTDQKLRFLAHHYEHFGHVDGGLGGEIDITDHERVIKRR